MPTSQAGVLAKAVVTTSGTHILATVPTGHRWIHRSASMAYFGTGGREAAHAVRSGSADYWLTNVTGLPNNGVVSWNGWQVLNAGDSLEVFLSDSGSLTCYFSGTDITL